MNIKLKRYYHIILLFIVSILFLCYFYGHTMIVPYNTVSASQENIKNITIKNNVNLFDDTKIHEVQINLDWNDYKSLIETYEQTGLKDYYKTDIVIDGVTIKNVGIRLKGNKSLMDTFKGSSEIKSMQLPFLIKFDKYVKGQNYQGITELAIRTGSGDVGSGEALLEEPLAFYVSRMSGAVVPECSYASVTVSDLKPAYYEICENVNENYLEKHFNDSKGVLYKVKNFANTTYKGDDQVEYKEYFDQKTKVHKEDFAHLIGFLKFINESSDKEFEEHLSDWVDVDSLTTTMAINGLVDNNDSFSGTNSNYYFYYSPETKKFNVLAWDMNLAFGAMEKTMARPPEQNKDNFKKSMQGGKFNCPAGSQREFQQNKNSEEGENVNKSKNIPMSGGKNVLKERFLANKKFNAMYKEKYLEIADNIYGRNLLLKKLNAISNTFTKYNSENNLLNQESYDKKILEMRNYIENKKIEKKKNYLI